MSAPEKTGAARLLTEIVLPTFGLEGDFLEAAGRVARLSGRQTDWANEVSAGLDPSSLAATRDLLKELITRVESCEVPA